MRREQEVVGQRSEFVRSMQAALARRLAAPTVGARHACEREMADVMRAHFAGEAPPRSVRDGKLAAVGERDE
jgi:hypothetical protein